jgi:HEPN domain-containing protein
LGLLTKAYDDYQTAKASSDSTVFNEAAWGFWIQQSIEKALKAWLVHLGENPPLTHDLSRLLRMLEQHQVETKELQPLKRLTQYAVKFRYEANTQPLGLDRTAFQKQVSKLLLDVADSLNDNPITHGTDLATSLGLSPSSAIARGLSTP